MPAGPGGGDGRCSAGGRLPLLRARRVRRPRSCGRQRVADRRCRSSAPPGTSSGPAASSRQHTWRACSPDAMHLRHEALVDASPETVYALAADVERWPSLHRAYRWCRVLARTPDGLVFEMTGRIRGWPARWTAVQERQPAANRLVFQHIKGITTGMRVAWSLSPQRGGTAVI